jgi:hypothetical protein
MTKRAEELAGIVADGVMAVFPDDAPEFYRNLAKGHLMDGLTGMLEVYGRECIEAAAKVIDRQCDARDAEYPEMHDVVHLDNAAQIIREMPLP